MLLFCILFLREEPQQALFCMQKSFFSPAARNLFGGSHSPLVKAHLSVLLFSTSLMKEIKNE